MFPDAILDGSPVVLIQVHQRVGRGELKGIGLICLGVVFHSVPDAAGGPDAFELLDR